MLKLSNTRTSHLLCEMLVVITKLDYYGDATIRILWIIYVVDCNDKERIEEARE